MVSWFTKSRAAGPKVFVKGRAPTEPVVYRFRPRTFFESKENGSTYVGGQVYHVRAGNDMLDGLVKRWKAKGLVEIL